VSQKHTQSLAPLFNYWGGEVSFLNQICVKGREKKRNGREEKGRGGQERRIGEIHFPILSVSFPCFPLPLIYLSTHTLLSAFPCVSARFLAFPCVSLRFLAFPCVSLRFLAFSKERRVKDGRWVPLPYLYYYLLNKNCKQ
jgi:hypothetical protein